MHVKRNWYFFRISKGRFDFVKALMAICSLPKIFIRAWLFTLMKAVSKFKGELK